MMQPLEITHHETPVHMGQSARDVTPFDGATLQTNRCAFIIGYLETDSEAHGVAMQLKDKFKQQGWNVSEQSFKCVPRKRTMPEAQVPIVVADNCEPIAMSVAISLSKTIRKLSSVVMKSDREECDMDIPAGAVVLFVTPVKRWTQGGRLPE
jgi:hypothetical protein